MSEISGAISSVSIYIIQILICASLHSDIMDIICIRCGKVMCNSNQDNDVFVGCDFIEFITHFRLHYIGRSYIELHSS